VRASQGKWADASEWAEYVERYHAVVTRALPPSSSAHVVVSATSLMPRASVSRTATDPPVTAVGSSCLPLPSCAARTHTPSGAQSERATVGRSGLGSLLAPGGARASELARCFGEAVRGTE
jgi:hypothetical protein